MKISPDTHCAAMLDGRVLSRLLATDDPQVFRQHRFSPWQASSHVPSRLPGESLSGPESQPQRRVCEHCGYVEYRTA